MPTSSRASALKPEDRRLNMAKIIQLQQDGATVAPVIVDDAGPCCAAPPSSR